MFSRLTVRASLMKIQQVFEAYSEAEKHSVFHMCMKKYFSRRKGIHAYINMNRISGYYESGEENRNGNLLTAKSWFFISIKECTDAVRVRVLVLPEPIMLLFDWMVIIGCGIHFIISPTIESMLEFLLGGGMVLVLLIKQVSETTVLQNKLMNIFSDIVLLNESKENIKM